MSSYTIREQIVRAVGERLESITIDNGYQTNLGDSVFGWLSAPLNSDDPVSLIYRDRKNTVIRAIGCHEHTLTIEAILIIAKAANLETVRNMIADVTQCVGVDVTWGGLAQDTGPVWDEEIEIEHSGKKMAGVSIKFNIEYTTAPFDPYTEA